jgi:hypothetical protein
MKQRIFSHFQDYLFQYISHQYQDLLYCNSSKYILFTYKDIWKPPRETGIVDVLYSHSISTLYNSLWYMPKYRMNLYYRRKRRIKYQLLPKITTMAMDLHQMMTVKRQKNSQRRIQSNISFVYCWKWCKTHITLPLTQLQCIIDK